eukprot:19323_3
MPLLCAARRLRGCPAGPPMMGPCSSGLRNSRQRRQGTDREDPQRRERVTPAARGKRSYSGFSTTQQVVTDCQQLRSAASGSGSSSSAHSKPWAMLRESGWKRSAKDFTSGVVAGVAQVLVGHPANTLKARLQIQPTPPIYSGMMDCLRQTVAQEGYRGLYRGMASPLVGVGIVNAVVFFCNEEVKRVICSTRGYTRGEAEMDLTDAFAAGATTGLQYYGRTRRRTPIGSVYSDTRPSRTHASEPAAGESAAVDAVLTVSMARVCRAMLLNRLRGRVRDQPGRVADGPAAGGKGTAPRESDSRPHHSRAAAGRARSTSDVHWLSADGAPRDLELRCLLRCLLSGEAMAGDWGTISVDLYVWRPLFCNILNPGFPYVLLLQVAVVNETDEPIVAIFFVDGAGRPSRWPPAAAAVEYGPAVPGRWVCRPVRTADSVADRRSQGAAAIYSPILPSSFLLRAHVSHLLGTGKICVRYDFLTLCRHVDRRCGCRQTTCASPSSEGQCTRRSRCTLWRAWRGFSEGRRWCCGRSQSMALRFVRLRPPWPFVACDLYYRDRSSRGTGSRLSLPTQFHTYNTSIVVIDGNTVLYCMYFKKISAGSIRQPAHARPQPGASRRGS